VVLILASASPRRRALLEPFGFELQVVPADIDETQRQGESPNQYVERLSQEKARAVLTRHENAAATVLAADTSVVVDGEVLGKPGTHVDEHRRMLQRLSGRKHQVLTGVTVTSARGSRSTVVTTFVTFRALSAQEIVWYTTTSEGRDKAGGYALQGLAGGFVTGIEGSVSSVVGLPLSETLELLAHMQFPLPWAKAAGTSF
jgi:septum formation protein